MSPGKFLLSILFLIPILMVPPELYAVNPEIGGDFTLTDHHDQPFGLKDVRGKAVVIFFGFTHCPGICPDSLAKMARVMRKLDERADQVSVLFITVDPERDTPEKLAQYVPFFSPHLTGLTGTVAEVEQVAKAYRARYALVKKTAEDKLYNVDHSADIYVLNRSGKVESIVPYGMPVQHILKVVEGVLDKSPLSAPVKSAESKPDLKLGLPDLDNRTHQLTDYTGKPVVINFWATWCPPCRAELPSLNRAWQALKDEGIMMLAVNVGESKGAVDAFVRDFPIDFPVLLDDKGHSMKRWAIKGMPTTVILDSAGKLTYHTTGEREWDDDEVLEQIRALKLEN